MWLISLFSVISCLDLVDLPELLLEPLASGSQKQFLVLLQGKDQERFLIVISTIMRLSPIIFLADAFE